MPQVALVSLQYRFLLYTDLLPHCKRPVWQCHVGCEMVLQIPRTNILEIHKMGGGDGKVTPEQNSFGKQLIVLQLMGSSQLSGQLLTSPVSNNLSFQRGHAEHKSGQQPVWKSQSPKASVKANYGTQADSSVRAGFVHCPGGTPPSCSEGFPLPSFPRTSTVRSMYLSMSRATGEIFRA